MLQDLNTRPGIKKSGGLYMNHSDKPFSTRTLYDIFLLSTFAFIVSALLLQFMMNLQIAIFLRYYSISFTYSIFSIQFSSHSYSKWSPGMIYFIYGLGQLFFFAAGLLLLRAKAGGWKVNLAITWLSFLMVNTLPLGLLAGIFIFDGLGIAYQWLIQDIIIRFPVAIGFLAVAIYFRSYWIYRFLKTAFNQVFLDDEADRSIFIRYCFVFPWFAGAIILTAFALVHFTWFWLVFIIGLGLIVLPGFMKPIPVFPVLINESRQKNLPFRHPLYYFMSVLLFSIIWALSLIKIPF